jgi:integrase/recombinase XerD
VHDCRHTYASHYFREGGNIFRLSRYLGHSSVQVTEKFYAHMIPADFEQDWGRNCLRVGLEPGRVTALAPFAP